MINWINKQFFWVNEKPPFYNIDAFRFFNVQEYEFTDFSDEYGHIVYTKFKIVGHLNAGGEIMLQTYDKKNEAFKDLLDFMKNFPVNNKNEDNILIDIK